MNILLHIKNCYKKSNRSKKNKDCVEVFGATVSLPTFFVRCLLTERK